MTNSTTPNRDQTSDAWIPGAPGEQLIGEVLDVDSAWSDYRNTEYPILTVLEDDSGRERKVHGFRRFLHD